MIKVSILYPNGGNVQFDASYYKNIHLPMVVEALGDQLKGLELDLGLASRGSNEMAPFVAIAHLKFDDLVSFQAAFGPHVATFEADVKNYTNKAGKIQISEIAIL